MARFKVGVQIHPQHSNMDAIRQAWGTADELGVDTLWVWDHFYPLYGDPDGTHFESWTMLAAIAVETKNARFGALVSSNSYRNPDLLADMARTIDHLSGGRFILGIGAGWFERDYEEYGYQFGTAPSRLRELGRSLPRIKARLARLNPPPLGPMPIMIGGAGERVTLKLTAQYAQMWNTFPPVDTYRHKNQVLTDWCEKVGRDPAEVERTVSVSPPVFDQIPELLEAGAQHVILRHVHPYDTAPLETLLRMARS
jgi:probable F420-dependent oxidoreductase